MAAEQNPGRDVATQGGGENAGGSAPVVEISCPSCDARYRVPANAISAKGRRVQCASCGEVWRAMPDSAVAPRPAPRPEPAPRAQPTAAETGGEGPMDSFSDRLARMRAAEAAGESPPPADTDAPADGAETGAGTATGTGAAPAGGAPERQPEKRAEQMAEIRRMLDDLKGGGTAEERPDPAAIAEAAANAPAAAPTRHAAPAKPAGRYEEDYVDPLREKLLEPDSRSKKDAAVDGEQQRAGLMRKHQKRSRRRRVAEKTRKSRGGFLTGLSLIVLVGALMTGTYLFRDRIAERLPGSGPALQQYAETVDAGIAQARAFAERARERIEAALGEVLED